MHSLGKRVLGDIVAALAHSHACGIVHRDVKPENLLVDATYGCLRLIDFGSACDCAGWLVKRGYRPDRVPCSVLYCPPEQLLDGRAPYTYDVYSAGLCWLALMIPSLGEDDDALFALRVALRDHSHDPHAWRRTVEAADADAPPLPSGFGEAFGIGDATPLTGTGETGEASTAQASLAWDLLTRLLAFEPSERPSAADVLVGPYLNEHCDTEAPRHAAAPWTLESLVSPAGAHRPPIVSDECAV